MTLNLIADVGGTNVRFACATGDNRLINRQDYRTDAFETFGEALGEYLSRLSVDEPISSASLAAAGPLIGDSIKLTNGSWTLRRDEISRRLNGAPVALFNDLQAAALSLPYLSRQQFETIYAANRPAPTASRLAVNVGTGFGASTVVYSHDGWISVPSEAGHMSLPGLLTDQLEMNNLNATQFACVEDILSGPGLAKLYAHLCSTDRQPEDILSRQQVDPAAATAASVFTLLLGTVCGDLVLATAAWGGIYLFGSVAKTWAGEVDRELFIERFLAKGKVSNAMKHVPINLVTDPDAPLVGLARN